MGGTSSRTNNTTSKAFFVYERTGKLSDKYTTVRQLGAGVGGEALLVKCGDSQYVAKRTKDMTEEGKRQFLDEFRKMTELQHPHCTKVIELVQEMKTIKGKPTEQLYVISELAFGGDLFGYVQKLVESEVGVEEGWFAKVIVQAMQGVAFMHAKGIVHNDLKPDNILVMEAFDPKRPRRVPWVTVNDFGSATHARQTSFSWGDPRYQSPETWKNLTKVVEKAQSPSHLYKVGKKADVWSMGVTLFELLSGGQIPFLYRHASLKDVMDCKELWTALRDGVANDEVQIKPYCRDCSWEAESLLKHMLEKDPKKRPEASEVIESKWFKKTRKATIISGLDCVALNHERTKSQTLLFNALVNKMKTTHYEEYWKVFQEADKDNSGMINLEEFKRTFSQLGVAAEDAEAQFKSADVDGDGNLLFTEFMAATFDFAKMAPPQLEGLLKELFNQVDDNNSGQINDAELEELFKGTLDKRELAKVFSQMDTDNDGKVTLSEFIDFLFKPCGEEVVSSYSRRVAKKRAARATMLHQEPVSSCLQCSDFREGMRLYIRKRRRSRVIG